MTVLSTDQLQTLLNGSDGPHASLYMPTVMAGQETRQNPIRFKNLLRELETGLAETGLDQQQTEALLAPAVKLVDDFEFWQHAWHGFALFLAQDFCRYHHLPINVDELTWVGKRFYLKPLLRLFGQDRQFYVLALSQNAARLLRADAHSVASIDLGDTPVSLAEAVGQELSEQQLQFHSGDAGGRPIYHGQGGGNDDLKPEIRKFLTLLDQGVRERIGYDGPPLLPAGVDYLTAMYREVSEYKAVSDRSVSGNVERLSDEELRDKAWESIEPQLAQSLEQLLARFQAFAADGRGSEQLSDILPAASDGRIDTLLVARGERRWGRYDTQRRSTEIDPEADPENEDLLDLAAVKTFAQGGRVFVCDPDKLPNGVPAVALYRY